jgi:hypothetical protein
MIKIEDNFIDRTLFKELNKTLTDFKEVKTPGKSFWVMQPSKEFIEYITIKISLLENKKIENILCFFREAKPNQDNDWRIHNDSIIDGQQPDRAAVIYMSENKESALNGTAFWIHKTKGYSLNNATPESFDKLLKEDSNDVSKWKLNSVVGHMPNRILTYPCNYFHSKYPKEFNSSRVVFVMFYKIIK